MEKVNGKRLEKWDNVKFFLIFLVVLGHIADIYADTSFSTGCLRFNIYTFHMPLFLFVSGLFSKKHIREKQYLTIFSYLNLYLFIKVIDFFSKWAAEKEMPEFSLFSDGSVPWYAFSLFAFSLIIIAIRRVSPKYVLLVSVILACVAGYDTQIEDFLCLSRIIVYFPFFYLGFILDAEKVDSFLSKKRFIPLAIAAFALTVFITIYFYQDINNIKFLFTGRNPYSDFVTDCPYAFIYRLLCYAVSTILGASFIVLVPRKLFGGFFARIGERTVQIYSLHFAIKLLYFGLINDRFKIDGYFSDKLIVYELLVSVLITAVCALPIWKPLFDRLLHIPLKKQ